jgi:choline dehydrogenase-like flavoprotein
VLILHTPFPGPRFSFAANKEVILSAGAIMSPQIALQSGIGPKDVLSRHGIRTYIDNPSVGQNISDHPLIPWYLNVTSNNTADNVFRDGAVAGADINQWIQNHTALFVDSPGNTQAYYRLPNSTVFSPNPASGTNNVNIENIYVVSSPESL